MARRDDEPVTGKQLATAFKWQDLAVVLAILGGIVSGYTFIVGQARAESDAGVAPLKAEIHVLESRMMKDEADVAALHVEVKEVQTDIRSLYRFMSTGEKQQRLESPLPDSGHVP